MGWNVLSTIRHDGVVYEAGSVIHEISDEAAKALVEVKVLAPQVEGQLKEDASTVAKQAEEVAAAAKTDSAVLEDQVEKDIQDSLKQNEDLTKAPAEPVTVGSKVPTAEEVAAAAAEVK